LQKKDFAEYKTIWWFLVYCGNPLKIQKPITFGVIGFSTGLLINH
jgi:hypothetical protein